MWLDPGVECRVTCSGNDLSNVKHLLSSHRSACKATTATFAGTASGKAKFSCHKSGNVKGWNWLPGDMPDGTTAAAYCAKQIRPPWFASSKAAAEKNWQQMGCRRAHGAESISGNCNALTQRSCQRSVNCACGLPVGWTRDKLDAHIKTLIENVADKEKTKQEQGNPSRATQAALSWWGAMCTCDVKTLEDPEPPQGKPFRNRRRSYEISRTIVCDISDDRTRYLDDRLRMYLVRSDDRCMI